MPHSWLNQYLLDAIQKMAPVRIRLASEPGSETSHPSSSLLPIIWLKDRQTLMTLLRNPSINFGDLYSAGRIDVEGDLVRLLEELYKIPQSTRSSEGRAILRAQRRETQ